MLSNPNQFTLYNISIHRRNFRSATAPMNSTLDVEVQGAQHLKESDIAATAPKPKRIARSRELAMLLENIDNLAPPSANPSDRDFIGIAEGPCRPVQSYKIVNCNKLTQSEVTVKFRDSNDTPASRDSSAHDSVAIYPDIDSPESDAPNSLDKAQQQQCNNPLHDISGYRSQVGASISLIVTGAPGLVYGDIVYSDDSSVAAAAVHAGLLSLGETKSVCVYILGPHKGFLASIRNNIQSYSYPKWPGSFSFVPDALQQATAAAAERKRVLVERRAAAKLAKATPALCDPNASEDDGSQSCSSSNSESIAAHWDTPAVPEHLLALADIGALKKMGIKHELFYC